MAAAVGAAVLSAIAVSDFVVIGTITASQVIGTAVITAAVVGVNYAISPKPEAPSPADGVSNLKQPIQPRRGVYGHCRVGGGYTLYETYNGAAVDIIAMVSGEIGAVRSFYIDDKAVTATPAGANVVVVNGLADGSYGNDRVRIDWRYGLDTETYYAHLGLLYLPFGFWTTAHRGDGIASLCVIANQWTKEDHYKVFPHGEPKVSAEIDGYALWDIRDPDQDPEDPTTWVDHAAWDIGTSYSKGDYVLRDRVVFKSTINGNIGNDPLARFYPWTPVGSNPVLQLIDYLTNTLPFRTGMRLDRESLITPVVERLREQADLCDELVELSDASFEVRYRSDGFFTFETDPEQVIGAILATCDGWMCEDFDGTLALQVGVYTVPTRSLSKKHILDFTIDAGVADEEEVNEIPFSFTYPATGYSEAPGDPWRDEDAITLSGKVRSQPLVLTWVQSHTQGRRLAKRAMARLNSPRRGEVTSTLYGLHLLGQRWIGIDDSRMGLAEAVVEVQSAEVDLKAGRVTFKWQLVDGDTIDDWSPDEEGDGIPEVDSIEATEQYIPQEVSAQVGGDPPFRIDLSWDFPGTDAYGYRIRYRLVDQGDGNPGPWSEEDFSAQNVTVIGPRIFATVYPTTSDLYEVQVASIGTGGSISEWSPEDPLVVVTASAILRESSSLLRREDNTYFLREDA